jgi:hypothetical protein
VLRDHWDPSWENRNWRSIVRGQRRTSIVTEEAACHCCGIRLMNPFRGTGFCSSTVHIVQSWLLSKLKWYIPNNIYTIFILIVPESISAANHPKTRVDSLVLAGKPVRQGHSNHIFVNSKSYLASGCIFVTLILIIIRNPPTRLQFFVGQVATPHWNIRPSKYVSVFSDPTIRGSSMNASHFRIALEVHDLSSDTLLHVA